MMSTNDKNSLNNNRSDKDATVAFNKNHNENESNHKQMAATVNNSYNSPKIGSRRIFTPQFKLQVLESYRNDNDCKGNQRATARKYNIHRRQIQKWLQCEASLRSSVANINQNSIKHQFHNVNMPKSINQQSGLAKYSVSKSIDDSICRYDQQYSVSPIVPESSQHINKIDESSKAATESITETARTVTPNVGKLSTNNLAIAVANVEGAAENISISTPPLPTIASSTVISPLRPMAIVGGPPGIRPSSILQTQHHQHLYRIPSSYLSIPGAFLAQHATHHQNLHQPHSSYQYHGETSFTHNITQQMLAGHSVENKPNERLISPSECTNYPMLDIKLGNSYAYTISHPDNNSVSKCTIKSPINNTNSAHEKLLTTTLPVDHYKDPNRPHYHQQPGYLLHSPIDLSLGNRRESKSETNISKEFHNAYMNSSPYSIDMPRTEEECAKNLTFRKRKVMNTPKCNISVNEYTYCLDRPKKQTKHFDNENKTSANFINDELKTQTYETEEEVDIEVEIDIVEEDKKPLVPKPIKLFKPYLLDDEKYNYNTNNESNVINTANKLKEASISPHNPANHQTADSNESCNDIVASNNFHLHKTELFIKNPNFISTTTTTVTNNISSPLSAFIPTISVPKLSPTFLQYSKGSPLSSGYESSSSTYSECSSTRSEGSSSCIVHGRSYNHNSQPKLYNDNGVVSESIHIQKWLDQDSSNQSATTSSIALYA